jgi:hypothetical protein
LNGGPLVRRSVTRAHPPWGLHAAQRRFRLRGLGATCGRGRLHRPSTGKTVDRVAALTVAQPGPWRSGVLVKRVLPHVAPGPRKPGSSWAASNTRGGLTRVRSPWTSGPRFEGSVKSDVGGVLSWVTFFLSQQKESDRRAGASAGLPPQASDPHGRRPEPHHPAGTEEAQNPKNQTVRTLTRACSLMPIAPKNSATSR